MMQYVWTILTAFTAYSVGRGAFRWALAAYVFSWFPLLILVFLPKKMAKVEQRTQAIEEQAVDYLAKKQFKGVNTVDDLFKQLETPKG
jgi:hypothetical protein